MSEYTAPATSEGASDTPKTAKTLAVSKDMGDTSVVLFSLLLLALVAVAGYFLVRSNDSPIVKKGALTSSTMTGKSATAAPQAKVAR